MLVKYSSSGVFKWPSREIVHAAVTAWAREQARSHPELLTAGYFGSYARGDWGFGSDVDIVVVVASSDEPFVTRAARWNVSGIPVDVDLLVYVPREWNAVKDRAMFDPVVWVYPESPAAL